MKNLIYSKLVFNLFGFLVLTLLSCVKDDNSIHTRDDIKRESNLNDNYLNELGDYIKENTFQIKEIGSINSIINSTYLKEYLERRQLRLKNENVSVKVNSEIGVKAYSIELQSDEKNSYTGLVILPLIEERNIYAIFFASETTTDGKKETNFESIVNKGNYFDPNYTPKQLGDKWRAWKNCMVSSWNNLTNDLVGQIACGLAPQSCLAACAIHCTLLAPGAYNPSMTNAEALQWLCDNGFIICDFEIVTSGYTIVGL